MLCNPLFLMTPSCTLQCFGTFSWWNHHVRFKMVHSSPKNAQSRVCYLQTIWLPLIISFKFSSNHLRQRWFNRYPGGRRPRVQWVTKFWRPRAKLKNGVLTTTPLPPPSIWRPWSFLHWSLSGRLLVLEWRPIRHVDFFFSFFFLLFSSFSFPFLHFWRPFSDPGGRGPKGPPPALYAPV